MVIAGVQIAMICVNAIICMICAGIYSSNLNINYIFYQAISTAQVFKETVCVNFDSKKLSMETLWDHLKIHSFFLTFLT